ncbi:MAG: hypothetical protein L6R42_006048 [Xanthoria sp. 1 TBL-2021]|nr:MAG: hypothetical protein L6R42_006048 [Xanthoria sp. 1 TBL-2021]
MPPDSTRGTMLNFFVLPCLLLLTLFAHPISCNPVQKAHVPSHFSITINPLNDPSPIHFDFNRPPDAQPFRITGARGCINAILDNLRTKDHGASVPREGIREHLDGVWFYAYPLSEQYTWNLLFATVKLVIDNLQTRGYVACNWEVSRPNDHGGAGRILGRGSMWPDVLTTPDANGNNASRQQQHQSLSPLNPIFISSRNDNFELDFHIDNPPHPLKPTDADGCLRIAFTAISHHDLDKPVSQGTGRLQAGNVILDIESLSSEYTWGLFDYTIRQVQAQLLFRGWWSCSWAIRRVEAGGGVGLVYAKGRMWSPLGEGDVVAA